MNKRLNVAATAVTTALLMIVIAVFASSCGTPVFEQKTITQIDQTVGKMMSTFKVPGAIVGVWQDGKGEYVKAYGKADLKSGRAITTSDLFKAASVTKTITGTLILELIDQGKLSLDDKLSKFPFASGIQNADKITVRMLLNQTSGLPDPSNESPEMGAIEESDPSHQFTADEIKGFGIAMGPLWEPGTRYHYSNWNYYLLGLMVENITRKNLSNEMQALFFDKLGMKNTRFDPNAEFLMSRTHSLGYAWNPDLPDDQNPVDVTSQNTTWTWAAGSAVTDINDFRTWIDGVANGTLLTPEMRKTRLADASDAGNGSQYGLGFLKTGDVIWHNGAVPGYSSYAGRDPGKGVTVCVFMNAEPAKKAEGQPAMSEVVTATLTGVGILKIFGIAPPNK